MARVRDRYEILDVIGHGATGVVHLARDRQRRRYVAAKVLTTSESDDLAKHRFLNEQQVALQHPHLLTPLDWYQTPHAAVLVMELADAGSIDDVLTTNTTLSPRFVEHVAAQALDGLAALHDAGILHRDIKPANLMLTRNGDGITLELGDFGLSVVDGATRLTQDAGVVGTLGYVAPEVLDGGPDTTRSDLWALGRTLQTLAERSDPPVPRRVADLIEQLTATNPDDRPPTATDALAQLDTAADDTPLVVPVIPDRVTASIRNHRRRRRHQRWALGTVALVVLALLGTVAATVITREADWLRQRKANAAAGKVDCLKFPPSAERNVRLNVPAVPPTRTFAPRQGTQEVDWLATIRQIPDGVASDELVNSDEPTRRVGQFRVRESVQESGWIIEADTDRRWIIGVTTAGEVAPGTDTSTEFVDSFIDSLAPTFPWPTPGDSWVDLGRSFLADRRWAVGRGSDTITAYHDSKTDLDLLPGRATTVLGRPAVVSADRVVWRETDELLIVLEESRYSYTRIDDLAVRTREQRSAAESLRPCTAAHYAALRSGADTQGEVVLTNADDLAGLTFFVEDLPVSADAEAATRPSEYFFGRGVAGSEGLAFSRQSEEATSARVWATRAPTVAPRSDWNGAPPDCGQEIDYPEPGGDPVRVEFDMLCIRNPPKEAVSQPPALYCYPGSARFDMSPGQSLVERPVVLSFDKPWFPISCTEQGDLNPDPTNPISFGLRASLAFSQLSCTPPPGTRTEAVGELIWQNGDVSSANVAVTFLPGPYLTIEIPDGERYGGTSATSPITLLPFDSACDDRGLTAGVASIESMRFERPTSG